MIDQNNNVDMEKIVSLCKRRGFIFPTSEIYGGFSGFFDYGHYGVALSNNIKKLWWKKFVDDRRDMYGLDSSIVLNPKTWEASGHVAGFSDPTEDGKQFNVMFKTDVGAGEEATLSYLRPETAQGIFTNFKNIVDTFHPKLPFGVAQIGKAFRNEIAPRDFIFRKREFEQMEIEYFIKESDWEKYFEYWRDEMLEWMESIGLDMHRVHELDVPEEDRAHYSKRTIDFEFDYPFGRKELFGLAYRGNYDLGQHKLEYINEESGEKIIPHVIEPSFGLERAILAILVSSYREENIPGEEGGIRTFLKLDPKIAPVICAVSPLLKNKPDLVAKAEEIFGSLKSEFGRVAYDDNGNIGKRYRRQDEIGTPWCIVADFETLEDDSVTVRDRDNGSQERIKIADLKQYIKDRLN